MTPAQLRKISHLVRNVRLDHFDVYVGRMSSVKGLSLSSDFPGADGFWGNPFVNGEVVSPQMVVFLQLTEMRVSSKEHSLALHRDWLEKMLEAPGQSAFKLRLAALRGRRLGCFCVGVRGSAATWCCHAQTLAFVANYGRIP